MLAVTEATFARQVLRAELPVLICFGAQRCPARRALLPALTRVAAAYRGQLLVASALVDRAPILAEQYGVVASPTLAVFQHGDRQGQVPGFLPEGLLRLLADEVVGGAVAGDRSWSPVEARFEDTVLIPWLERGGFIYQRQVSCAVAGRTKPQRGRIDLLVFADPQARPVTLIESKRQISGDEDLRRAVAQAAGYARSLGLPSFVVAAPRGLWIYRFIGERATCVAHVTGLELHQAPERPQQILLQLHADSVVP
jgi:thioredoxin 1